LISENSFVRFLFDNRFSKRASHLEAIRRMLLPLSRMVEIRGLQVKRRVVMPAFRPGSG